jgi:16S rRNA (cytosine967-C5)-methyltransferase
VLVDAPCSGLGTLRRNPDLKWRLNAKSIDEMVELQAKILESACRLVKSGGRLVYATCSPLRREDEGIAEAFSAAHPEFRMLDAGELLTASGVERADELNANGYFRSWPHQHGMDGFFAAAWQKA